MLFLFLLRVYLSFSFLNFIVLFFSEVSYCGCRLYFSLFFFVAVHSVGCCLQPLIVITCSFSVWWAVVHYCFQLHTDTALRWISEPKFDATARCLLVSETWIWLLLASTAGQSDAISEWTLGRLTVTQLSKDFTSHRPGHCPEIPEILKVVLKFTPCPEFFADVLKFLSTSCSMGMDAPVLVSLRPNCGPWKLKGLFVLWHCWRYETNSTLVLLVSGNYCIFPWL